MNIYCPDCGTKLGEPRDLRKFWITLLKCPSCINRFFLEVGDMKWVYPLQRLESDTAQRLLTCDESLITKAVPGIKHIDYKTVSIVAFELQLKQP